MGIVNRIIKNIAIEPLLYMVRHETIQVISENTDDFVYKLKDRETSYVQIKIIK